MSLHLKLYLFKSLVTTEEFKNRSERLENESQRHSEGHAEIQETRFGPNRWCECGEFSPMPTDEECLLQRTIMKPTVKKDRVRCSDVLTNKKNVETLSSFSFCLDLATGGSLLFKYIPRQSSVKCFEHIQLVISVL